MGPGPDIATQICRIFAKVATPKGDQRGAVDNNGSKPGRGLRIPGTESFFLLARGKIWRRDDSLDSKICRASQARI